MTAMFDEELISIVRLAKALNVHISTIYRWGTAKGVRGQKLKLIRIGGRTFVQRSDWLAFVDALNNGAAARTNAAENEPSSTVDAELDAAGI